MRLVRCYNDGLVCSAATATGELICTKNEWESSCKRKCLSLNLSKPKFSDVNLFPNPQFLRLDISQPDDSSISISQTYLVIFRKIAGRAANMLSDRIVLKIYSNKQRRLHMLVVFLCAHRRDQLTNPHLHNRQLY